MRCAVPPPGEIEYRGETTRPARWYFNYEDWVQPNRATLSGFSVEVPMSNEDRILVVETAVSGCVLTDGFVAPAVLYIGRVDADENEHVYSTRHGSEVLRRHCVAKGITATGEASPETWMTA